VPSGYEVDSINFAVADNKSLTDPITASASGYEAEIDLYNLKTGTRYYYSVNVSFKNGAETAVSGSFKTAPGPRLMNVPGVNNMRDIGGWTTTNGSVIKQGLLYRGCEIDGAVEAEYAITAEGIEIMLTELGIRFDMDLRLPEENKHGIDILGSSVEHTYYSAPMYVNVFKEINAEKMRAIFADLADESNYPIYMHCTYGQDRTGTVCYILEALLGLSEEDLMKEYQLSALYHGYQPMDKITEFVDAFKNLEGESMSEKAEGYLLSIGVTAEEIANIRRIHLSE
jgi:protein tyrosine/serine phosphatase